jgi:hypothetical protein
MSVTEIEWLGYAVVVLGVIAIIAAITWKVHREGVGWARAVHGTTILRPASCEYCTGGAQALIDPDQGEGGWGPIPRHMRIVGSGSRYLESPLGNIRSCPRCKGIGHTWREVPVNHGHVPPNTGMIEDYQKRWSPWETK